MTDSVSLNTITRTLSAATATLIVPSNPQRKYLLLQNTGTGGPVSFGTASTVTAGGGFVNLDVASSATGQGGSAEFVEVVPDNAIYAISTAGTTITVTEG